MGNLTVCAKEHGIDRKKVNSMAKEIAANTNDVSMHDAQIQAAEAIKSGYENDLKEIHSQIISQYKDYLAKHTKPQLNKQPVDITAKKTRLTPLVDNRINSSVDRLHLLAKQSGWAQEGGELLRDANGKVAGRTTWIAKESWYGELLKSERLNQPDTIAAVNKAVFGEPMSAKEKRSVTALLEIIDHQDSAEFQDQQRAPSVGFDEDYYSSEEDRQELIAQAEVLENDVPYDELVGIFELSVTNAHIDEDLTDEERQAREDDFFGASTEVDGGAKEAIAQGQDEGDKQSRDEAWDFEGELTGQTNAEAVAQEREQKQRDKQAAAAELKAKQKEQADREIDTIADEMFGNIGTNDIFGGNPLANLGHAEKPKPAETKGAVTDKAKIEDFGEKLGGSRKDKARLRAITQDFTDEEITNLPLSKIWPVSEIDSIEDKFTAAVAAAARGDIPSKPRVGYKVKRWIDKVKTVRELVKPLLEGAVSQERFIELGAKRDALKSFFEKVTLLDGIDRSQWGRIGQVSVHAGAYKYDENSQKIPAPYVNVHIDGKTTFFDGATSIAEAIDRVNENLGSLEPVDAKLAFEVRYNNRTGEAFINKKGDKEYRHLKDFPDAKAAKDYLKNNYADVVKAWDAVKDRDNVKEKDLRREVNRPRTSEDYRKGKDITSEQFEKAFGFRAGEFGEWVKQGANAKERQGMVNQAYDAFMDLAKILDIPSEAISLNGSLGMAFGSRGNGWASAHFEPGNVIINLTKTRGAGSLAHEWFHALDNYFSRMRGGEVPFSGNNQTYRKNNYITYKPEPMYAHKAVRTRSLTLSELKERQKQNPTAEMFKQENWQPDPAHKEGVRPEVEEKFAALVNALNESPMAKRARLIDKNADGYWSRIIERGARSFENYVIAKMAQGGYHNDYLANVVPESDFIRNSERYPYLKQEEIAPIEEAFDNLFGAIETKQSEQGTALFSKTSEWSKNDTTISSYTGTLGEYAAKLKSRGIQGLISITREEADRLSGSIRIVTRGTDTTGLQGWFLPVEEAGKSIYTYSGEFKGKYSDDEDMEIRQLSRGRDIIAINTLVGMNGTKKSHIDVLVKGGNQPDDLYSKSTATTGSTIADVKNWLPARVAKLVAAGKLEVVQDAKDAPATATSFDAGGIEGYYDAKADKLLIIASSVTKESLPSLLSHELMHRAESIDPKVQAAIQRFEGDLQRRFNLAAKGIGTEIEKAAYARVITAKTPLKDQQAEFRSYINTEYAKDPNSFTGKIKRIFDDFIAAIRMALVRNNMDFGYIKSLTPADLFALSKYGAKVQPLRGNARNGSEVLASFAGQKATTADKHQLSNAKERLAQHKFYLENRKNSVGINIETIEDGSRFKYRVSSKYNNYFDRFITRQEAEDYIAEFKRKYQDGLMNAPEGILLDTGWHKGIDGKWRFEIDDSDARLLATPDLNKSLPLSEILSHDKLFSAYPKLNNMKVDRKYLHNDNGEYHPAFNKKGPYLVINATLSERQFLSTLLHEIQHNIQDIEGFASGGSPEQFTDKTINEKERLINQVQKAIDYRFGVMPYELKNLVRKVNTGDGRGAAARRIIQANPSYKAMYADYLNAHSDLKEIQAMKDSFTHLSKFDQYQRLAGEVEARNTQSRQKLTAEQRKTTRPFATQDVIDRDVIVVFNGKEMANAPMPDNASKTHSLDSTERLAPNGKPSNLNAVQYAQVRTPEFLSWFGDWENDPENASQVVDENGEPMLLLHGTTEDINAFRTGKAKKGNQIPFGAHFTSNRDIANQFAETNGGNVVQAFLNIRKPIDLISNGYPEKGSKESKVYDDLMRKARLEGEYHKNYIGSQRDGKLRAPLVHQLSSERGDIGRRTLLGNGFDGVVYNAGYSTNLALSMVGKFNVHDASFVALNPNQVKSATGNNGEFSADNNDIRFSRAAPITNVIKQGDGWLKSFLSQSRKDSIIYNLQNRFIDWNRQMEKVVKNGGTISEESNPDLAEELSHQRTASRIKDFYDHEINPVLKGLHHNAIGFNEFQKLLHARHAPSRNAEMAGRNPNQEMIDTHLAEAESNLESVRSAPLSTRKEIGDALAEYNKWNRAKPFNGNEDDRLSLSGMTDEQAEDFINSLTPEQRAVMLPLADKVDAINNKTLDLLVEYGMETEESVKALKEQWEHYVPLHRDEAHPDDNNFGQPIGRGFSVRGSGMKNATGSNAEVTNILAHITAAREQMLRRGEKNKVTVALADFIKENPDSDFAEINKIEMDKTLNDDGLVDTHMEPLFKRNMADNVVMFRVGGKDHAIVFNKDKIENVRLALSLKNLDGANLDTVESLISKGTRWFSKVNTQYNVIFGVVNLIRDTQGMALNLTSTALHGKQGEVFRNMGSAFKAIAGVERESKNVDPALRAMYDRFNKAGGTTGYAQMFEDISERNQALEKELKRLGASKPIKLAHAGFKLLSDFNTLMENSTRLAVFMTAVNSGMTDAKAASIAKNITVNFNRKGAQSTKIGAFYAFFNASAQGTARLAETMTGPQGKQIMASGVALGAITTLLGLAMMGDDEWEKIPEFVRERSLIIPTGKSSYISIPMPLGFHLIPNIGRKVVESAFGSNRVSKTRRLAQLAGSTVGAFNPLGGSDISEFVMPTVLDPALALWRNKDYTGRSIYKEDFNSQRPTPGFTRSKDTASTFSKLASEGINKVTGGTNYKQGLWSPTPDQIDYVLGQLSGGTGREALKLEETIMGTISGEEVPLYKVPLVGRFAGETSGNAAERSAYYDNMKLLNEHNAEIEGLRKDGKSTDAILYIKDNPESKLLVKAKAINKSIDKLNDQRKLMVKKGVPVTGIDKLIATQMKQLNDAVAQRM